MTTGNLQKRNIDNIGDYLRSSECGATVVSELLAGKGEAVGLDNTS